MGSLCDSLQVLHIFTIVYKAIQIILNLKTETLVKEKLASLWIVDL